MDLGEFVAWAQACGVGPDAALKDYLASPSPRAWELREGPPPAYGAKPPSPAKLRKAKEHLRRALEALGEGAE